MQQRQIGDRAVSAIGFGGMPISVPGRPDEAQAIDTVHAALDAGITLVDTADAYSLSGIDMGHNEILVAKALRLAGVSADDVLVATKGGHRRHDDGGWYLQGDADYIKAACDASLQRLDVEAIGLYQYHRPDPAVPYEETIGALRDLLDAGKIRMAGISNADVDQIRLAHEVLGGRLAAVQNQFSPGFRSSLDEVELCAELGIAFLAWSPLGGAREAGGVGEQHSVFGQIAEERGVSPQQVTLAWELAQASVVIPIPGARRRASIEDSARAVHLELSADELARLNG